MTNFIAEFFMSTPVGTLDPIHIETIVEALQLYKDSLLDTYEGEPETRDKVDDITVVLDHLEPVAFASYAKQLVRCLDSLERMSNCDRIAILDKANNIVRDR